MTPDDGDIQASDVPRRRGLDALVARVAASNVPVRVPSSDRAAWRVSALCLALDSCRGRGATVAQIHVLMWGLRDSANAERLVRAWTTQTTEPALRAYEPLLNDAISLSVAGGLVELTSTTRLHLTPQGAAYCRAINETDDVMEAERRLLTQLRPISTADMWRRLGVPQDRSSSDGGVES